MNSSPSDREPIALRSFAESQIDWLHRCSLIFLAGIAVLAISYYSLPTSAFAICAPLAIAVLFYIGSSRWNQRQLVIRDEDFFTIGGSIDQPLRWADLQEVSFGKHDLDLVLVNGSQKQLLLKFLPHGSQQAVAMEVFRHWQMNQDAGPFRFPPIDEVKIRSPRLTIEPICRSDREFFVDLHVSEPNRINQLDPVTSNEWSAHYFDLQLAATHSAPLYWYCLIMIDGRTPIGVIMINLTCPILRQASLGIDIATEFVNRGFGSEAIAAMLDFVRHRTNLIKVTAGSFSDNIACIRALEKAGMKRTGTFEKFWFKDGTWKSGHQYEMVF